MIIVKTSHNHIWNPAQVAAKIIAEYQTHNKAVISLNAEGPCCDAVKLYELLDHTCKLFGFDKTQITIQTWNAEELHPEYTIQMMPQHWHKITLQTARAHGYSADNFKNKKTPAHKLFGCLYNIPSWNRLSLLSYIKYQCSRPSLLACNGTWEPDQHNSYYLNPVTDFCPEEFGNISRLLNDGIGALPNHPGHKPDEKENTAILSFYNDFFVDIVAETYTNGLTFFPTEKTFRPMYALTPFVTFGPQGFLTTLRSTWGFQTFDKWWDESYDNYQNYERIKKMYQTIKSIDCMTDSELTAMYADMQSTLDHNYNTLLEIKKWK